RFPAYFGMCMFALFVTSFQLMHALGAAFRSGMIEVDLAARTLTLHKQFLGTPKTSRWSLAAIYELQLGQMQVHGVKILLADGSTATLLPWLSSTQQAIVDHNLPRALGFRQPLQNP